MLRFLDYSFYINPMESGPAVLSRLYSFECVKRDIACNKSTQLFFVGDMVAQWLVH